jgi:hypothetical protein
MPILWILVGAFVAAAHHYFSNVHQLVGVVDAVLAIVLWPLVLLGVHIHV